MPYRRVAALYDIHGNHPALDAVLEEVRAASVDLIVVGGDVVPGPMPVECMKRLNELHVPALFLHGNGDREILTLLRGGETSVPEPYRTVMHWVAHQLTSTHEQVFASWPLTQRIEIEGIGPTLFCHATPRNDMDIFTKRTDESLLVPIFEPIGVSLVVCGHTHMQFDRMIGSTRVVNAGSIGMPFGRTGAHWLLLGPGVELRRTEYDLAAASGTIYATTYPGAVEFADKYLLNSPSEEDMLSLYASAELR